MLSSTVAMEMITLSRADILPPRAPVQPLWHSLWCWQCQWPGDTQPCSRSKCGKNCRCSRAGLWVQVGPPIAEGNC